MLQGLKIRSINYFFRKNKFIPYKHNFIYLWKINTLTYKGSGRILNGCDSNGKNIISNFNNFNIQETIPEFSTVAFKVDFQGQHGTLNIQLKRDTCNFRFK